MTIRQLIKAGKMESRVDEIKEVSCVNIGFINNYGREDETQLTVYQDLRINAGVKELADLFKSLAEEFETTIWKVTYVIIVASADTGEELEDMGY